MSDLFKLKNGTVLLSTEAPGGIYNAAQLKKIAELCSKELAIVKATEDQRLALFVKESEVQQIVQQLKGIGLGFRNYQAGLHQPVSCLGELCEVHEQPALESATELTQLLGNIQLQAPLKIGINGCARCCAPCQTLDIAVIGEMSGYRISLGGKTSQVPELATFFAEGVPAKELPRLVKKIVDLFQSKAEPQESLQEVLERCGVEDFIAALAPYSQDAAGRDDPFAVDDGDAPMNSDSSAEDDDSLAPEEIAEDDLAMETMEEDQMEDIGVTEDEAELVLADDESELDVANTDDELAEEAALEKSLQMADEGAMPMEALDDGEGPLEIAEEASGDEEDFAADDVIALEDDMDGEMDEVPIRHDADSSLSDDLSIDDMHDDLKNEVAAASIHDDESSIDDVAIEEDDVVAEESWSEEAEEAVELVEADHKDELVDDAPSMTDEIPDLDEDLISTQEVGMEEEHAEPIEAPEAEDGELLLADDEESVAADLMTDEDELRFEQTLQASIEEEKKLMAVGVEDSNQQQREEALSFLESGASPAAQAHPPKAPAAPKSSGDRELSGIDIEDSSMRIDFSNGAYVSLDLSNLIEGESKLFKFGRQSIAVTHEVDGYSVELEGMRLFQPHQKFSEAS